LGTAQGDSAYGLSSDSSGNIFIAGYTLGDLDGGGNDGQEDMFVSRFNGSTFSHTSQIGTAFSDGAMDVVVSGTSVYVTGFSAGSISPESGSVGTSDVFLMLFTSSDLTNTWIKQIDSPSVDIPYSLDLDGDVNIYITGETTGNFDGESGSGLEDILTVKYDSACIQ